MALNVIHLVALILGVLVLVSAVCAVSGVNRGWLKLSFATPNFSGSASCGTLKCTGGGQSATWADIIAGFPDCNHMDSIGKAVLALDVIGMVLALASVIFLAVRAFDLSPIKLLSVLAGVFFIIVAVTLGVSWMAYIGGFVGTCLKHGGSADGDYAFAFAIIGMVLAIPAAVLSFVGASKEAPSA